MSEFNLIGIMTFLLLFSITLLIGEERSKKATERKLISEKHYSDTLGCEYNKMELVLVETEKALKNAENLSEGYKKHYYELLRERGANDEKETEDIRKRRPVRYRCGHRGVKKSRN